MKHPRQKEITRMADVFEPDEIAEALDLTIEEVNAALPKSPGWILQCNKTGRRWQRRTARNCYFTAQLVGLVDYDLIPRKEDKAGAGLAGAGAK